MTRVSRRILWTVSILLPAVILSVGLWSSDLRSFFPALGSISGSTPEIWTVSPRTMNFWVEATGILRATSVRDFGAPPAFSNYWQFQIVNIAPEGRSVKKGDLLVGFDAQKVRDDLERFQNELDQAVKELEKARAQIDLETQELSSRLAAAENKYEKLKLKQEGLSSALEASSTIESDRLALEQARREVAALRDRIVWHKKSSEAKYNIIASRRVRAEFKVKAIERGMEQFEARAERDGVVVYKLKWNGDRYQVGENVWSWMSIVEIPNLNTIQALAYVPEVDLGKVRIGQKAEIAIEALRYE